VACLGEKLILRGNLIEKEGKHFEDLGIDGSVILK
jgi:hypothetical protein